MTVLVKSEGACHGLAEQEEIFPQLSAVDVTSIMFDSIWIRFGSTELLCLWVICTLREKTIVMRTVDKFITFN